MLARNVTDSTNFALLNVLSWIADAGVHLTVLSAEGATGSHSHAETQGMSNSDTFSVKSGIKYNVSMSSFCIVLHYNVNFDIIRQHPLDDAVVVKS